MKVKVADRHEVFGHTGLFLKDGKAYYSVEDAVTPVTPRRAKKKTLHNRVILNAGDFKDDGTWHGTLKEGVRELIEVNDDGDKVVSDTVIGQDKLQYMPWLGYVHAAFRLTTEFNGNDNDFVVRLLRVEKEGYISPCESITFTFYFGTDWNVSGGAPRWFLRSINFESIDGLENFLIVSNNKRSTDDRDVRHQGELLSRDYGTDYEKRQSVGLVIVTTGIVYDISKAYIGAYDYTAHGSRNKKNDIFNNFPYEAFFLAVFAKVGALINGQYHPLNYNREEDIEEDRLVILDWCRYFNSSSTALTGDASFKQSVYNVFFTEPLNGSTTYEFNDFWTQRQNMILNGNSNSNLTYVKYLIDSIYEYHAIVILNESFTADGFFKITCKKLTRGNGVYLDFVIDTNNGAARLGNNSLLASFGSTRRAAASSFIERVHMFNSWGTLNCTLIGQMNNEKTAISLDAIISAS